MRILMAGGLYFLIVFGAGFLLGSVRVLWLEPRIGPTAAVLCEAPFILAAIVFASRWVPRVVMLQRDLASLLLAGCVALSLQQIADFGVGIFVRGISPEDQIALFATPQGAVYAALLVLFTLMPAMWLIETRVTRQLA